MIIWNINRNAISIAKNAKVFGLILGTLGRQGSNDIFNRIKNLLEGKDTTSLSLNNNNCNNNCNCNNNNCNCINNNNNVTIVDKYKYNSSKRIVIPFLMAELNPIKMAKITNIDVKILNIKIYLNIFKKY